MAHVVPKNTSIINRKLINIKLFDVGGIWPARFLIFFYINRRNINLAAESKPFGENGVQHVPIFFLISGINRSNYFFVRLLTTLGSIVDGKQEQRNRK
jgi:hypothetical protein